MNKSKINKKVVRTSQSSHLRTFDILKTIAYKIPILQRNTDSYNWKRNLQCNSNFFLRKKKIEWKNCISMCTD